VSTVSPSADSTEPADSTESSESTERAFVHPTAEIEPGVVLGDGARIWRHAHVRAGARIGADCNIGANVFVDADVRIGDRVKIQNNVSVYEGVEVEDDAFIGPAAVFTNDFTPRSTGSWQVMTTKVGNGASVGANATVVCGNDLGEHCLVAAGAVVTKPVLPHQLVMGNPARPAGWVCRCGVTVSRQPLRPADLVCGICPHA
jgi:UDP-2-acetamido-3-amino-2,3-dideoxy-glucuronate N-acetyltransferase